MHSPPRVQIPERDQNKQFLKYAHWDSSQWTHHVVLTLWFAVSYLIFYSILPLWTLSCKYSSHIGIWNLKGNTIWIIHIYFVYPALKVTFMKESNNYIEGVIRWSLLKKRRCYSKLSISPFEMFNHSMFKTIISHYNFMNTDLFYVSRTRFQMCSDRESYGKGTYYYIFLAGSRQK